MEELEALRRCREGDRTAFRLLVERYGDLVTRSAYLMTHDRALAEDLAQEAFLAAWRGLCSFDVERPLKPWLLRILVNGWLNHRRRWRPPQVSIDSVGPLPGPGPSPEAAAVLHETHRSVRQAVESLDDGQRVALLLRYFAGLSVPEIASAMSCPQGTVKSRLHRALAELRARLQGKHIVSSQTDLHGEPATVGPFEAVVSTQPRESSDPLPPVSVVVWRDGDALVWVSGDLPVAELLKVADSLYR